MVGSDENLTSAVQNYCTTSARIMMTHSPYHMRLLTAIFEKSGMINRIREDSYDYTLKFRISGKDFYRIAKVAPNKTVDEYLTDLKKVGFVKVMTCVNIQIWTYLIDGYLRSTTEFCLDGPLKLDIASDTVLVTMNVRLK